MPEPCLHLWPFAFAPAAYRALSSAGGDEDLVVWCPLTLLAERWPCILARLLELEPQPRSFLEGWGWVERHTVAGGMVLIVSHS
jgi:hypothetical protein